MGILYRLPPVVALSLVGLFLLLAVLASVAVVMRPHAALFSGDGSLSFFLFDDAKLLTIFVLFQTFY